MKYISIILILLLASCSLPKDLRHLKRGSKKLQKLVIKYPELKRDTIIRDTIPVYIVEYIHDTIFTLETDTVYDDSLIRIYIRPPQHFEYEKEGVKVSLDRVGNQYKLTVESVADTIYVPFETKIEVIQPAKIVEKPLSWWQKLRMDLGLAFLVIILLLILVIILKITGKITIPFLR